MGDIHDEKTNHEEDEESHGHEEAPHEASHDEPWLVSYADLMTLLFGFFVLMYTFAMAKLDSSDPDKMVKMREEVAKYFGGEYITPQKNDIDEFKHKFVEKLKPSEIETKISPEGVEISFRGNLLFDSGEAQLKEKGKKVLKALTDLLMSKGDVDVIVEGHTDDIPLRANSRYSSNWELSGSRSASVIEELISHGMSAEHIKGMSFADTKPLAPNRDAHKIPIPANQARNRRVTIKIVNLDFNSPVPANKTPKNTPSEVEVEEEHGH